jgi:hypothetical protein
MNKTVIVVLILIGVLFCAGCGKEEGVKPEGKEPDTPPAREYTLSYSAGPGGSIIGDSRQMIHQGDDGSAVTAEPDAGYSFDGWSDGVPDSTRTDRNVTADLTVTARFEPLQHTLTYLADSGGSIEGVSPQTVPHGGDGNAVTAVPAAGYSFAGWSDGVADASRTDHSVTADLEVTARFAPRQYALTYQAGTGGSLAGTSSQTVPHEADGSAVTAVPATGYSFAGWSDGVPDASRTDRRVTSDLTVTARFVPLTYTLTYTAGAQGAIDGAGQQTVNHGSDGASVQAVPVPGYHFVRWSDGSTANPRTDRKVTSDLAVQASFALNQYTLTYAAGEGGAIEGDGRQTVNHGDDGSTVKAVPLGRSYFVRWSDGVETPSRTDIGVTSDLAVTAEFAVRTYTVGGIVSGLVEGTSLTLQNNGGDDLTVSADGEFTFSQPIADGSDYAATVLTQPTAPNQVCIITSGAGTVDGENLMNIRVECQLETYSIGGTLTGLPEGGKLTLQINQGDDLELSGNGNFVFSKKLEDGSSYEIAILRQDLKPKWSCWLGDASGKVAGAPVTDVDVACYPDVEIQSTAGFGKIDLTWNSQDFTDATFNLCLAREEIPADGFSRCQELKGGVLKPQISSPKTLPGLTFNVPYWLQLEARHVDGHRTYSPMVAATPFSGFNDTGIDWCADNELNRFVEGMRAEKVSSCDGLKSTHPRQDGGYGRDVTARARKLNKTGGGSSGFDFTKVCGSGQAAGEGKCPPNPTLGDGPNNWACTRDNVTGLLWEMKTSEGLHGQGNTYSWYVPDETVNGGAAGVQNGGKCQGSACDTQAYVQTVNAQGLCGGNDWRLPSRKELVSIVDNGRFNPAIDLNYFPNTSIVGYWSASPYADQKNQAWQVIYRFGEVYPGDKNKGNPVRLVRQAP